MRLQLISITVKNSIFSLQTWYIMNKIQVTNPRGNNDISFTCKKTRMENEYHAKTAITTNIIVRY